MHLRPRFANNMIFLLKATEPIASILYEIQYAFQPQWLLSTSERALMYTRRIVCVLAQAFGHKQDVFVENTLAVDFKGAFLLEDRTKNFAAMLSTKCLSD